MEVRRRVDAGRGLTRDLVGQLQKPYRKGSWKDPNATGYTGAQWPGEGTLTDIYDTLYQGADVTTMRKA